MKIAVPALGKNLDAQVSDKPGTASHLIVIDMLSKELQWFEGPGKSGPGTGLQFITMAINEQCDVFLTGWLNPVGGRQLEARGIKVITGMAGRVSQVLEQFERGHAADSAVVPKTSLNTDLLPDAQALANAFRQALTQIGSMLPVIAGVVFLIGLLTTFIPNRILFDFFLGSTLQGIFKGALVGSFFTGNPANSYIIGKQLLDQGIDIGVVIALICSWVTVGIVQFPAESAALGKRFAVARNALCFILSMVIALVMASII
ncbi:NifB/NifX family molybdenum-iron cluster-binding protein [uncultured Desulfobacter sp.]|uniref:NifB/NifX family molybdenum-iron cluster-binding protein n=1 Tax=uncultured Desulfobacter sp. TaxID=240139 RepID=UPI0029F4E8F4|nr:NifB/NifX family molybdenum-iron cluster-binding protein [uncultured Desulfobacter sp.]